MTIWQWILYVLTWLSGDPTSMDREAGRAAAAVMAARASMLVESTPPAPPAPPAPTPPTPAKCSDCQGTGWIVHGDGHRTRCPCGAAGCPDGRCPVPSASPSNRSPASVNSRR